MIARPTSPLVAAVGLVAVTADGVRRLPALLPAVVHHLDEARHAAFQRYDELALHGRDVLAGRPPRVVPDAVTEVPVTEVPVTEVPVTEVPVTEVPVTEVPVTEVPVTEVPVTEVPVTAPPAPTPPIGLTEPVELPEDVLDDVAQLTPGGELKHAELPLPDFDHLTVPQLRGRLRTLELPELVQLRDYEQAHGHRLPVLTLLDNRIAKLLAEPDR